MTTTTPRPDARPDETRPPDTEHRTDETRTPDADDPTGESLAPGGDHPAGETRTPDADHPAGETRGPGGDRPTGERVPADAGRARSGDLAGGAGGARAGERAGTSPVGSEPVGSEPVGSEPAGSEPAGRRAVLRLGHPRELLALVPYQLGFVPRDSAVLVALRPPGRRLGVVARADLPDLLGPGGPRLAADLAAHLRADGAAEVVVVLYAGEGDPRDPERGLRTRAGSRAGRAADVLGRALAHLGPVTVWSVDDDRYVGLDCRDRGCCPVGGSPLADLSGGEIAGRLVARRGGVAGSREELGVIRPAAPGPRRSASAARSRWLDALLRADGPDAVLRWRRRSLAAWRGALAGARGPAAARVPSAALGRVEAALLDPVVRDAVVLTLVAPDDAGLPDALLVAGSPWPPGVAWSGPAGWTDDEAWPGEDDAVGSADRAAPPVSGERRDAEDSRGAEDSRDGDAPRGAVDSRGAEGPRSVEHARDTERPRDADRARDADDPDAADVSERVRAALDRLVDPVRGREPCEDVAAAGWGVLERVVAHGRRDRQAPALTLLALLAWWDGDAVRASVLVDRALDQDPGHRLAELLDRALGAGLPPGWVRRRC
ncbi:DUF4192 domain-containing protein [Cellulomonas sp.]|uniref:DUF4192 domain-containing protein n=1 Tax=Cellulomonas sp. TaxID=40001 RepID=UPI002D630485|nr:DUF4192 family protein [Cellulomonas sp.]HYQ76039.1 DUF4192 family protein [Cellulomonas sp.]